MHVFEKNGICVDGLKDFVIDPSQKPKGGMALISHAHSDHVKLCDKTNFLVSEQTAKLIRTIYGEKQKLQQISFGKKIQLQDVGLTLHNSGHILGSSQILLEGEKTIAITSDFKLQNSILLEGAKVLQSDVLVIESTFGLPSFAFPEREIVYSEISNWVRKSIEQNNFVVLAGYSLGKSQELTAIMNKYCNQIPIVHEAIFKNNKAYEELGVKLGKFLELDHNLKESNVLIMPPSLVNQNLLTVLEEMLGKKVVSAIATGWQYRGFYDKVFHLSDHADFSQLMQYVKESNPKMVFTMHGQCQEFAGFINRRLKIPAKPLDSKGQQLLTEFA